jgi:hypothetical protein
MRSIDVVRRVFDRAAGYSGVMMEAQWLRHFAFLETTAGEASPEHGSCCGQPYGCSQAHLLLGRLVDPAKPAACERLGLARLTLSQATTPSTDLVHQH